MFVDREFCLVLEITCNAGSMSDIGFESALEQAFERQLGPELRSQLNLTRSAIRRLGRDRTTFKRAAPEIFSSALASEEVQALFSGHGGATSSIAFSLSGTSAAAALQAKSRRKKTPQTAQAAEGAARVVEAQDADQEEEL